MRVKVEILVVAFILFEVRAELGNDSLQGPILIRKRPEFSDYKEENENYSRHKPKKPNSKSKSLSHKVYFKFS